MSIFLCGTLKISFTKYPIVNLISCYNCIVLSHLLQAEEEVCEMREETEAVKNQIRIAAQDEKNQLDSKMGDLKSDLQDEQARAADLESKVN